METEATSYVPRHNFESQHEVEKAVAYLSKDCTSLTNKTISINGAAFDIGLLNNMSIAGLLQICEVLRLSATGDMVDIKTTIAKYNPQFIYPAECDIDELVLLYTAQTSKLPVNYHVNFTCDYNTKALLSMLKPFIIDGQMRIPDILSKYNYRYIYVHSGKKRICGSDTEECKNCIDAGPGVVLYNLFIDRFN